MSNQDHIWMKMALAQAAQALEEDEVPVGCVITYQNQIIARAYNQVEQLNDPTAHAEMIAITSATQSVGSKYLDHCHIYITVEPCFMCAGAIHWSRFARVVYGAPDPKKGFTLYQPQILLPKVKVAGQVLEDECRLLMNRFFMRRR